MILEQHSRRREIFNPAKSSHISSLKTFLNTGKWGSIQFYAEQPYTTVPATVLTKFALHKLGETNGANPK